MKTSKILSRTAIGLVGSAAMLAAAHNQHSYYLQTISFLSVKLKDSELMNSLLNAKDRIEAYNMLIK